MYIFLIGYLYVILMIAAVNDNLIHGGLFLLFFGVLPAFLVIWLKRRRQLKGKN